MEEKKKEERNHFGCINRNTCKKKTCLQLRERFGLSTPGLRDQCSNHWANEANTLYSKIGKSKKQRNKQKRVAHKEY